MKKHFSHARRLMLAGIALATASAFASAPALAADPTKIKFQLDWKFEGPSAIFLYAAKKGYFKEENLDVTVDSGNGSGGAVTRVASGAYDMGFADMGALMEFVGNNPTAPSQPFGVLMVYNDTPAAVLSMKKSNIKTPKDLEGKKMGAPSFDAGRRTFPLFAQANKVDVSGINWTSMDPDLRETMLMRGDVDAITGFIFTSLLNLNARGVKDEDVSIMPYPDYGVKFYSNAVIVSPSFAKANPEAVKGFLRAVTKSIRDLIADPNPGVAAVKERDGIVDSKLELKRLKLAITLGIDTPDSHAEGFGDIDPGRMAMMASAVTHIYNTKVTVVPEKVFDRSFLPPKSLTATVFKK